MFVTKTGSKFITKPETVSVFRSDLAKLRPAFDTFERSAKTITVDEVKKLFPTGKFSENNYLVREMKNVLSRIEPKPKKVIDLSPELTAQDYKLITDMMNLHDGKYIDVWKGFSDTDLIPNIEKLALFNRSMRLSKQADDFLQFNPAQWDIVVDGIVRKPKDAIIPLLEYKVNSDEINKAGLLKGIKFNGKNLGDEIENLTQKIEADLSMNNYNENEILNFIENNLVAQWCNQARFMSTAMTQKATDKYAQKILWKIKVPAGTKGASIESFNIEREAEAEFLLQRGSRIKIVDATYNKKRNIWELEALIAQPNAIDKNLNNVRIKV